MIRKSMTTLTAVALTAVFATAAAAQTGPVTAQTAPHQDPPGLEAQLRAKGEAYSRAPDSEQNPTEVATTVQLNTQIAAQNEAAALMEQREASVNSEVNSEVDAEFERANQRYLADKAAHDANQAEYMRAREAWDGLIQACVASGRRDCTPPPPPPPTDMPLPPPSSPQG